MRMPGRSRAARPGGAMRQAGAGGGCADSDTGAVDLVQWPEHLFLSGLVANPPRRGEVCRLKGCFLGPSVYAL